MAYVTKPPILLLLFKPKGFTLMMSCREEEAAHLRRTCRDFIMKSDIGSSSSLQRSVRAWSAPPRGDMLHDSAIRESRFVGEPRPIHLFPSVLVPKQNGYGFSCRITYFVCEHVKAPPFRALYGCRLNLEVSFFLVFLLIGCMIDWFRDVR